MIGQTLSHYKILEKLGEGGMGVVYKAEDTKLKRTVALKFLPPELTLDPEAKERFIHEAQAASALEHANICSVHEIEEHEGQTFIVMGYYKGETLKKRIEGGLLVIEDAVNIVYQTAQGLLKAHEAGIIHRDIKPANIIVTTDGVAKILDFGLAKVTGRTLLTKSGTTLGTAAYMSPEQARGESVDKRTDIWSLGVTFYEMLTGKRPFQSEYEQALVYSILNEEPKSIRELRPDVPEAIEKICRRAIAKDVKDRYQTVDEFTTDLDSYKAGTKLSQKTQKVLSKKRSLIYGGLVVILVALALIFNPFNLNVGVQQNIAQPKPSLAIIGFENIPDPADKAYTGEMLTNYLITAFFQTKDLDVVSRERLFNIQQEMGQVESKVISSTMASQIARRAGVSCYMLGSILQLQPTLTVSYRLIDVTTGKIINTKRVSGYEYDKMTALVDTLALMVKHDLNIAPSESSPTRSVMDVTTKSPDAYRAYIEGVELIRRGGEGDRIRIALQKAIHLDSTFAMPHYYIGLWFLDQAEIRKAWELRANATEKERILIGAVYMGAIEEDLQMGAQMYEQFLQLYPHEQSVYGDATITYLRQCEYNRTIEVIERGLRYDSLDQQLLSRHAYFLASLNKQTEALNAADKYLQLIPAGFTSYDTKGDVLLLLNEPDSAIQYWRKAFIMGYPRAAMKVAYQFILKCDYSTAIDYFRRSTASADESGRAWAERDTALVSIHRGELTKANRILNKHLERHRKDKLLQSYLISGFFNVAAVGGDLLYLILLAYEAGNYKEMLRYANQRSIEIKKQGLVTSLTDPSSPICGRYEIAWALIKSGKENESSRIMEDLQQVQRSGLPWRQSEYDYFNGLFALERGEYNDAVVQFRRSMSRPTPNHAPQYHYAVALLKSGHVTDAIGEFQRMTWRSPIDDDGTISPMFSPMFNYWPIAAVKAHYWLGVAYEQQGKRAQAVKEYDTFLDTWKYADFKSKEMLDARTRLVQLGEMKR